MTKRKATQIEIDGLKEILRVERERNKKELNLHLIKVLELKPDKKYMLFFPKSAGLTAYDLEKIHDPCLENTHFLVEEADGIIALEK